MHDPKSMKTSFRLLTITVLLLGLALPAWLVGGTPDLRHSFGFQDMEILKLDWGLGPPICGDINGDSLNDITVCNNAKSRIELLLQKPGFDPAAQANVLRDPNRPNDFVGKHEAWRFQLFHYPLDVAVISLAATDMNGDNRLDLAYHCAEGLRIVYQDVPAGSSSPALAEPKWHPEIRFDLPDTMKTSKSLAWGDLNGDGRMDLALLAVRGYYLALQTDSGAFERPLRYYSSADTLKQVDVADINGDGLADLMLVAHGKSDFPLLVRRQGPDGILGPERRFHLSAPAVLGICRLDDSLRPSIVSVSQQTGRLASFALTLSEQTGDSVYMYPLPLCEEVQNRAVTCGDINGDGLSDMIVTNPVRAQFLVFSGRTERALAPAQTFPGLKDMRKICAGRLEDKTRDTLVVLSYEEKLIALSQYQQGRLSFPQAVRITGEPQTMDLADINHDSQADLIYVSRDSNDSFTLHTVFSIGTRAAQTGPSVTLDDVEDPPLNLLSCDIDHDGLRDIMVVQEFDPLMLIRQTTPGEFARQTAEDIHIGLVTDIQARSLSVAPLASQGRPALLAAQGNFVRALCFNPALGWQIIDQYPGANAQSHISLALTFRGRPQQAVDIITYDESAQILGILERQDDGTYQSGRDIKVPGKSTRQLLSGTFSNAREHQLVLYCDNALICMDGADSELSLRQETGFEPTIKQGRLGAFAAADINSDGKRDLVVLEQDRHHIQILNKNENGQLVECYTFQVFEQHPSDESERFRGRQKDSGQPRYIALSDVTGDGKTDLVIQVHDRIIVYPQD